MSDSILQALVIKTLEGFFVKKKAFTTFDIWMQLRLTTDTHSEDPTVFIQQLFLEGVFPQGYIAQIVKRNEAKAVLFRYSRYAKEYKYEGLLSKQRDRTKECSVNEEKSSENN